MKTHRQFAAMLAITALFCALAVAAASPSVAHPTASEPASVSYDTPTIPIGCDAWSEQAAYPIPISQSAVASQGSYIYSFGGWTISDTETLASYKFDGNTWSVIASLPVSLTFPSAVSDGAYVYVIGTTNDNSNMLYRYDPNSNTYTALTSPFTLVFQQSMAYLNGKIYRFGTAFNGPPNGKLILDVYTIATNQWQTATNYPLPEAYPALAVAFDGYLYAAGSPQGTKTYRYDTNTNLWEDAPVADLPMSMNAEAAAVLNGKWLLMGTYTTYSDAPFIWDAGSNTWQKGVDVRPPRMYMGGATLANSFYVIGGLDGGNQPITDVQSYTSNCPAPTATPAPSTPTPSSACDVWQEQPAYPLFTGLNAVVGLNGHIYSFGGMDGSNYTAKSYKYDGSVWTSITSLPMTIANASAVTDGSYIYLLNGYYGTYPGSHVYRYDPAADSYTELASSPYSSTWQAAVYLNGNIYLIGGRYASNEETNTVSVYDISANTWHRVASYPIVPVWPSAVALDGYIYVAGDPQSYNAGKTYRYDPATNNWSDSAVADAPLPVVGAASDIFNGEWLIAGGFENDSGLTQIWNPTTNSWRVGAPMVAPRASLSGATLGHAFYAFGGTTRPYYSNNDNQRYTTSCQPTPQPTPTLCATPFQDISGNVFYGAIAYLYCNGAVNGTDATHYSPAATSTRGQFARVVVKAFGMPLTTPTGGQSFTDVPPGYFAYNYIESGLAMGILSGYAADQCAAADAIFPCYLPNRPITRAELTKLVVKAAGYALTTPASPHFVDVPPSYFAYSYIETAYAHNVIRGVDSSHFAPARSIRRDEMAQVVYKGYITPLSPAP